nr:MAG TPA: hypothetical protein [Caudoviricetes sp.]
MSAPFSCRPVRLAVAELYAPATGRLVFPLSDYDYILTLV